MVKGRGLGELMPRLVKLVLGTLNVTSLVVKEAKLDCKTERCYVDIVILPHCEHSH